MQYHPRSLPAINVTQGIRGDAFDTGVVVTVGVWLDEWKHRRDLAVLGAPDVDASLESRILLGIRLRIGHVDVVFLIDVDAAGAAELLPLIEEAAVLIEDLDSAVPAVAHKDPSSGIHRDAVGCDELARAGTVFTPRLDKFPVFGEFHNAPVALGIMSVADENIAVRRNHDVGRSVEHIRPLAGDASLSERHQDFSIRAELEDLMTLAIFPLCIGDPYITVWCHGHAVGLHEHVRAKTLEQLARAIKLEDGRLSSVKSPDVPFGIGIDRNHRAPFNVGGERRPTLNDVVRILLRACGQCRDEDRRHDDNECQCRLPCVGHRVTSLSQTLPGFRAAQGYHFLARRRTIAPNCAWQLNRIMWRDTMNTRVERILGIVLVFFAAILAIDLARAAADHPGNSGAPEDEAAIKQAVAGFSDGWNSHDAHAMCLSLADDVQWVSWRGEVSHTRKQVEDDHAALFAALYKNSQRTDTVKAIRYLAPELASVDNFWSMTGAKTRDGSDWPYRAGYVNFLMAKRSGRWVIIVSHTADFNAKAPDPPR